MVSASYIVSLEHRLAALTAERDRFRAEAICLSEELQGLQALSEWLSSERDNLRGVVEKMQRELRELRRMLFGRKSERFIPSDPSQLKLDFEGVAQLQQEREYAALQESASISRNKPATHREIHRGSSAAYLFGAFGASGRVRRTR